MGGAERKPYIGSSTSKVERWERACAQWNEKQERTDMAYTEEGVDYLIEGLDGTEDLVPFRIDSAALDEAPDHVKTVIRHAITRTYCDINFSKPAIEGTATVHMVLTSGDDIFTFKVSKNADNSDVETDVHQRHVPSIVQSIVNKWFSDLDLVRAMNWVLQHRQLGQQPSAPQPLDAA